MRKLISTALVSLVLAGQAAALPIGNIDAGDGLYLDSVFSNALVQVIRIDRANNFVKVRHGNGYTEWVRPSRLLTREQSAAHEVGETVVWGALIVCLMDPTICEN